MTITEKSMLLKQNSPILAATDNELRNHVLSAVSLALNSEKEKIFEANRLDLRDAEEASLGKAVIKRLAFNEDKLRSVTDGISSLIGLPDPLGRILLARELDDGLVLRRTSCPIGVIGIIFEARPDALVQISSLCIKSGNCAILKGGRETSRTNRVLFDLIYNAAVAAGLPADTLALAEDRSEIAELLTCDKYVDLIIPRGSNSFVQYIMSSTNIPVMGHADGVCHIFADRNADIDMAADIITDAKTQYVSVCNAVETVLIDYRIADDLLKKLIPALKSRNVLIYADKPTADCINRLAGDDAVEGIMEDDEFHREYLDYKISLKIVDGLDAAITHINTYGSHHTDCIITKDSEAADRFMQLVDSANVYQNCSTRFADGFRYGLGAEVGIGTGKLHARGPVGLDGLVTYKYKLYGSGQTVRDYAEGKRSFRFKDL